MKKSTVCLVVFAALGLAGPAPSRGKTVSTCAQYETVKVGPYIVQADYWHMDKCPGTQCVDIDDKTGAFTVTKSTSVCPDVSGYPSVVYGNAWGLKSAQSALPAPLASLQSVASDWAFSPTYTGSWDAAYDIWVSPGDPGSEGYKSGGAEVMIWLDYFNTIPGPAKAAVVNLSGREWEVYQNDATAGANKWKYIAYLAKTPVTSVKGLAVGDFLKDSISRGYIKPDWYLCAVEAGNEMRQDGVPFTSRNFSVSVNQASGTKTTYVATTHPPTPTPLPVDNSVPPPPGGDLLAAGAKDLVFQDFSADDPKAGGTFADSNGSTFVYSVQAKAGKPGGKYLVLRFNEVSGGYCGMFYRVGNDWNGQDWTGAKAVRFLLYSKVPQVMGFTFKDKNNNQYTADGPSTKGTGWETVRIPLGSFKLDPYYTPPDAVKGAPLDLSAVKSFNFQPKTGIQATVALDGLTVVK